MIVYKTMNPLSTTLQQLLGEAEEGREANGAVTQSASGFLSGHNRFPGMVVSVEVVSDWGFVVKVAPLAVCLLFVGSG